MDRNSETGTEAGGHGQGQWEGSPYFSLYRMHTTLRQIITAVVKFSGVP